jgi:hypothetical protein
LLCHARWCSYTAILDDPKRKVLRLLASLVSFLIRY